MKLLLPLVLGVLALCTQIFVQVGFGLDEWAPDLLTVLVLWLGTTYAVGTGALIVAVLGLVADGFAGSPLGFYMLHALLLFHLALILSIQVRFQGALGWFLFGTAGAVVSVALLVAISRVFLGDTLLAARIVDLTVPRVVGVVIAVPLLFPLLDRLAGLVGPRPDADAL